MGLKLLEYTVPSTLSTLSEVVGFIWEQFTQMAADLLTKPIFLIGVGIFVVGAAIGLVKRIL